MRPRWVSTTAVILALGLTNFLGAQTVTKQLYLTSPAQGLDRIHPGLISPMDTTTATSTPIGQVVVQNAANGLAIWHQNNVQTPQYKVYNGSTGIFASELLAPSVASNKASVMMSAQSPTNPNEAFLLEITDNKQIYLHAWNGTNWNAGTFNPLGGAALVKSKAVYTAAIKYTANGNAMLVWDTDAADNLVHYRTWNGTAWSAAQTFTITTGANNRALTNMRLAAHPTSSEMILVFSDDTDVDDYAYVWNGTSWGNGIELNTANSSTPYDVSVAYEGLSGQALVVYAKGDNGVFYYRTWNGSAWGAETSRAFPAGATTTQQTYCTALAPDPHSDRILLGFSTQGSEGIFMLWDGSAFSTLAKDNKVVTGMDKPGNNRPLDVAFESLSGEGLAVVHTTSTSIQYLTWNTASGWSAQTAGPGTVAVPRVLQLFADPASDKIMAMTNVSDKSVKTALWNGSAWGTATTHETDTGFNGDDGAGNAKPFTYFWQLPTSSTVPTPTTSFTMGSTLCSNLSLPAGGSISVTAYINLLTGSLVNGNTYNINAVLKYGTTTIATLNPATYSTAGGNKLTWTGTIGSAVNIPAGQAIALDITMVSYPAGVSFAVLYDSNTKPSRIELPTTTYINVNSVTIYNAAYSGGNNVTELAIDATYYVRIAVSDPFGFADVNGINLAITNNLGTTNLVLGASDVVNASGCGKTYERSFTVPANATTYSFSAVAMEGYEGTVTHTGTLTNVPVIRIDAVADQAAVDNGEPALINVLTNDKGDINTSSLTIVTPPQNGTVQIGANGLVTYLPNGTFSGNDQFTYQICTNNTPIVCDQAIVSVTVGADLSNPCSEAIINKTFYLPFPENTTQLYEALYQASDNYPYPTNNVRTVVSIKVPYPNTVIYYDHWEDGYETSITSPVQPTSKIWGDGNPGNGFPPGFPSDILPAGASIVLDNVFSFNPRNPADIYFDGKDKMFTNSDVAVSKISGEQENFGLQAVKGTVQDVSRFGKLFRLGIGEISGVTYLNYAALFITARNNGTVVNIDLDQNGTNDVSSPTLNEGEVWFYQGDPAPSAVATAVDVKPGAIITANNTVGVELVLGDNLNFGTRNVNVLPDKFASNTYYTPVPTVNSSAPAVVYFVNNNETAITVNWQSGAPASGSVPVPAKGYASLQLALSATAAYKFWSADGKPFQAYEIMDADATSSTYDWGINLIAASRLTNFTGVAWAPGSLDGTRNDGPVWLTPTQNTTVYVKFDGDLTTVTPTMSPCNLPFDIAIPVNALNYVRIKDNSDNDQSGAAFYTCDGTTFSAVYGEDASTALTANPSLDVGTTMPPRCLQVLVNAIDNYESTQPNTPVIINVIDNDAGFLCTLNPSSVSTAGLMPPSNGTITVHPDGTITYTPNNSFAGLDSFEYQVCSFEFPAVCDIAKVYISVTGCTGLSTENSIAGKVFIEQLPDDGIYNTGEAFAPGVQVDLYSDLNCNGSIDGGDQVAMSTVSDLSGNYEFSVVNGYSAKDNFDPTASYFGNDGSVNWTTAWIEQSDNGLLASGDVQIIPDPAPGGNGNAVRLDGPSNGISRSLVFSGATSANVKFSFRREGQTNNGAAVLVQMNGSTIYTITDGNGVATDNYYQDVILTLTPGQYNANASNTLQFITNGSATTSNYFWIDNVELIYFISPSCFIAKVNPSNTGGHYSPSLLNTQANSFNGIGSCDTLNNLGVLVNLTATPDTASTSIDVPVLIPVLANDVIGVPNPSTVTTSYPGLVQPANGTVTVNPDGTITYMPNAGYYGSDLFQYRVCSAEDPLVCSITYVTVNISCSIVPNQNTLTGVVFDDVNANGVLNPGDEGHSGVKVKLYRDVNGDGILNAGDVLMDSVTTSASGGYQFNITPVTNTSTYLDQFATNGSGTGSNGTITWSNAWVEIGEANGFGTANIYVTGNQLRIQGNGTATVLGASRSADLTNAVSATLSFSYAESGLDLDPSDYVDVEVSSTGTGNWVLLQRLTGADGNQSGTLSFNVTPYISATTTVRFVTSGSAALSTSNIVNFDNVQFSFNICVVSNTVLDQFNTNGVGTGNNGTANWATDWTEFGETNGLNSANIYVTSNQLYIRGDGNSTIVRGASRTANLANATSATLSFDFRERSLDNSGQDTVFLQIATSASGPWTTLHKFSAFNGNEIGSLSFDITAYKSATTTIRFADLGATSLNTGEGVELDNVQIAYLTPITTKYIVQLAQPIPTGYTLSVPTPSPTGIHTASFDCSGSGVCQKNFGLVGADVTISKSASPSPVNVGQPLTYTLVATNNGPSNAQNVVVTDAVTAFPSPQYATSPSGPWTSWTGSLNIGTLAPGQSSTLYIRGNVSASQCSPVSNQASIGTSTSETNTSNNASTVVSTTVNDATPPVIASCAVTRNLQGCSNANLTGPVFSPFLAASSEAVFENATNQGNASDNCGITEVNYIDEELGSCPITFTRTWTIKDAAGNSSSCQQTILINDTTAPVVTGSLTTASVEGCSLSNAPAAATTVAALEALPGNVAISDNCLVDGALFVTYNDVSSGTNPIVITRTYTISDQCNNTATVVHTIQISSTLSVSGTKVDVLCRGNATGSINITASGGVSPYTYNWGGGITTEDRSGLAAGNYTVTVTAANGCTATASFTISQPAAALSATGVPTQPTCAGGESDGAINLTAAGGTSPYTYDWADLAGTSNPEDRSGLTPGTYQVTVTDANGCTTTQSFSLTNLNCPPNAVFNRDTTEEDTPVTIDILANDTDTDGNINAASVTITGQPHHGTVTVNGNGTLQYTPSQNFSGLDTLIYQVCDDGTPLPAQCDTAIVYLVVTPAPDIAASATQACNDNGTPSNNTDDYIIIELTATNPDPGASNQYQVYNGTDLLATGTYGSSVILEWRDAGNILRFVADGVATYSLSVRDADNAFDETIYTTTPEADCSPCPTPACPPVLVTRILGGFN